LSGQALQICHRAWRRGRVAAGDEEIGIAIVRRACKEEASQIANNGGQEGAVVIENIRMQSDGNYGFNAATAQYEDLFKAGVVNPTKVTPSSLQNAGSIASLNADHGSHGL
jgi:chaperonin GroEL